jgi:SAM-dependent methyltransferase
VTTAIGRRAYCGTCFHGWRIEGSDFGYAETSMCSLGTSQDRLDRQISFFRPFTPENADVLEIGCATGELAAAARKQLKIARYEAIELSPAGDRARGHLDRLFDRPLRQLLDTGLIHGRFDLVVMSHVLEHLSDPVAEINAIKLVLKPSGVVFIEVPNGAGNRRLPIDDNVAHLHFFCISSLCRLLCGSQFEVTALTSDIMLDARYADSLQLVAHQHRAPAWSRTQLSDHTALKGEDNIIVWGAGSLAAELLGNFFDRSRIAFFVDRDPAKQGKTCLGRPVLCPEAIGETSRTVLVNSIDFAPAIVADLSNLYPSCSHRIVLISNLFE